jgi:uncharacterized protein YciI
MLYVFHMIDKPGSTDLRLRVRPDHKVYLKAVENQIAFAGPLLAEDGEAMAGSLLVIDFPSLDAARAWLADEPFTRAGLYASTAIHAFSNMWQQKTGFPPA